ncbi:MAG: hypothetical protein PHE83_12530 [Opitutaceae bacterium]|nr:hypothetical protein [Opitutaceae bacterium]
MSFANPYKRIFVIAGHTKPKRTCGQILLRDEQAATAAQRYCVRVFPASPSTVTMRQEACTKNAATPSL